MKTIEERAKEVGMLSQVRSDYPYDKRSVEFGYTKGVTEQKVIDINKACEWLKNNLQEYGIILFGHWEYDFRKAMEE